MEKIGQCKVQYANHLFGKEGLVLRGDRSRGDVLNADLYANSNNDIILKIEDGISIEGMITSAKKGSKNRMDIHFEKGFAQELFGIVNTFADEYNLELDNEYMRMYNPNGREHIDGLPLGIVKSITSIPVECNVHYSGKGAQTCSDIIYIDAEHYPEPRGKRVHIGANVENIKPCNLNANCFELKINSIYVRRFAIALDTANKILKD